MNQVACIITGGESDMNITVEKRVAGKKDGLDTMIEQGGRNLSGGQKQSARNVLTGATSLEVDNRKMKMKMNGAKERNAVETVMESPAGMSNAYSGFGFVFKASRIVTIMETTAPMTVASSAPTNADTTSCGNRKDTPDMSVMNHTSLSPLNPLPTIMTIKIGHNRMNGES